MVVPPDCAPNVGSTAKDGELPETQTKINATINPSHAELCLAAGRSDMSDGFFVMGMGLTFLLQIVALRVFVTKRSSIWPDGNPV